jgi:hypothetical protein
MTAERNNSLRQPGDASHDIHEASMDDDPPRGQEEHDEAPTAWEHERVGARPSAPAAIFSRRRRGFLQKHGQLLLVAVSVAAGALLQSQMAKVTWTRSTQHNESPAVGDRGRIGRVTLQGPGGPVTLPMDTPVLVNVFLQGCADCFSAFESMKEIEAQEPLANRVGLPVVNVAYGRASEDEARRFGVGERLVVDPAGEALVQPLGIATFTTLIIDETGRVRLRDRPNQPGYVDRLLGAARVLKNHRPPSGSKWDE